PTRRNDDYTTGTERTPASPPPTPAPRTPRASASSAPSSPQSPHAAPASSPQTQVTSLVVELSNTSSRKHREGSGLQSDGRGAPTSISSLPGPRSDRARALAHGASTPDLAFSPRRISQLARVLVRSSRLTRSHSHSSSTSSISSSVGRVRRPAAAPI